MKYRILIILFICIFVCTIVFSLFLEKNDNINTNIINDLFHTQPLYDDDLKMNKDNMLYNLGDLLLVPKLYGYSEWINVKEHSNYKKTINTYKNSILSYYDKSRKSPNEEIPNFNTIQKSIDFYIEKNVENERLAQILNFIDNKRVVCVHLRTGDFGDVEPKMRETIKELQKQYDYVIIICGLHYKTEEVNNIFIDNINSFFEDEHTNILISIEDADFHMAMYRKCKNLLVHKGGFTVLASISFQGDNLYIIPDIFTAHTVLTTHFKTEKINVVYITE